MVSAERRSVFGAIIVSVFLVTLTMFPKTLTAQGSSTHLGIATAIPAVTTYILELAGLLVLIALQAAYGTRSRYIPVTLALFAAFLPVGVIMGWGTSQEHLAGILELLTGVAAWCVGAFYGGRALQSERAVRVLVNVLLGIVAIEALVTIAQRAGIPIHPVAPATAALLGDRTNGTFNHPDNLGKGLLLILILSLGLMGSRDDVTRRRIWATVLISFIPLGLSQGRANELAAVTMLVLWAVLAPGRKALGRRIGIPLITFVLVLPFIGSFVSRIESDPEGGARPELARAAREQIARQPLLGTGPNTFVSTVAPYDAVVAEGYSVHNTFLLTAAELGIPGAAIFWLPLLLMLFRAWLARSRSGYAGSFGLVLLASVPGLYVVLSTGWAMLSGLVLPMWFVVMGVAYSQVWPNRLTPTSTVAAKPNAERSVKESHDPAPALVG